MSKDVFKKIEFSTLKYELPSYLKTFNREDMQMLQPLNETLAYTIAKRADSLKQIYDFINILLVEDQNKNYRLVSPLAHEIWNNLTQKA